MVSKRVADRMASGLKRLIPIIQQQKARDVSEADTVTLVKDLMSEVLGYDKYTDLTSEYAIRGTYCDLAVTINGKLVQLVEVKSIGMPLEDRHVKQAVDYAANQGIEWVILTNAINWRMYNVLFSKPIDKNLIAEIDLCAIDFKKDQDLERFFTFTKEGHLKGDHVRVRDRQAAISRYMLASLLAYNDAVKNALRRELRRVVDVAVDQNEITSILIEQVIKRDALEGPAADQARKQIEKFETKPMRCLREQSNDQQNTTGNVILSPSTTPPATPPDTGNSPGPNASTV